MMKTDYCAYHPKLAADLEITEQRDGARTVYIVGSAIVGRYLLLRATENQVVGLIDGARVAGDVCAEFNRVTGATLKLTTLVKFLGKLDGYGILAGERSQGATTPETPLSQTHYIRFKLFNPDPLFARLAPRLRWIWTTGFFVFSASLMVVAFLLALMNWAEVSGYGEATLGLLVVIVLMTPWSASVGNYGALIAIPGREAIIRAPESATLIALDAQPGAQVASGASIGRMGNFDLEEQLVQAQSDLARANADYDRLLGELRMRGETAARAELLLRQRRNEFDEISDERRQNSQGIMPRSELDAAETRAATLTGALAAARERLEAAFVEHRRKHANTATEMNVARADASAERLQIEKLTGELKAMREIIGSLEERRDLLQRKRAQFELITPRAGAVFGEDLPRMVGNYFQKGAEICRVADTRELLLRLNVLEREIGDVRGGYGVRLKMRAYPDRVFRGVVSKIGGESEMDQNGQATYRVELTIENGEGLLRPGMTAFARIDFDRRMIGLILLHKIKQALRPELWMF